MNNTRRLTLGFGVIALGFCAALPFRQTPKQQDSMAATARQEELELGKDLPLQVPGQKSVSNFRSVPPNPKLDANTSPAKPSTNDRTFDMTADANHEVVRPPALPDNYQPLFQPQHVSPLVAGAPAGSSSPATKASPRYHTIHDGDTLESLALRYLGSAGRAREIFAANRDTLTDPNILPIGVKIIIPRSGAGRQPLGKVTGIHGARAESVHMKPLAPLPGNHQ